MEINPRDETISLNNKLKTVYTKENKTLIRERWQGNTASPNLEKNTTKLCNLTKTLIVDKTKRAQTVLTTNSGYWQGSSRPVGQNILNMEQGNYLSERTKEVRTQSFTF